MILARSARRCDRRLPNWTPRRGRSGAKGRDVKRLVIGETLRTVAVGITLGITGAAAGVRVLRGLVYGVSAADPLTFIAVPMAVTAVAVLAAIPARRASRVDPITVLRTD